MWGELNNLLRLCVLATASLLYCYFIAAKLPKGMLRLLSLFPVITLFYIIPFSLHTLHFGFPAWCCLAFANFKLLLFAFNQGPLSSPPPQDVLHFILLAGFLFKIQKNDSKSVLSPISEAAIRATMVTALLYNYDNCKRYVRNHVILLYFFYTYHEIQLLLAMAAIPARVLLRVHLEPQFNSPLLSTSLQDFWGHRWNLRVSELLRATVYTPIRTNPICIRIFGNRWATLPAVLLTFIVSGLVHELIYYHMSREIPTWEVTWFFVLQGVFVDIEIILKKKLVESGKFRLHRAISGPLALANIAVTAGCLSYIQVRRYGIDQRFIEEFNLFLEFSKIKA
ncbi:hypothetical protein DITRI_Ditri14bG0142100 [Diplodiscus trichospermus]